MEIVDAEDHTSDGRGDGDPPAHVPAGDRSKPERQSENPGDSHHAPNRSHTKKRDVEEAPDSRRNRHEYGNRQSAAPRQSVDEAYPKGATVRPQSGGRPLIAAISSNSRQERRGAQSHQHHSHQALEQVAKGRTHRDAEDEHREAHGKERETVPDTPSATQEGGAESATLAGHDRAHRYQVIGVQRVPHPEREPEK